MLLSRRAGSPGSPRAARGLPAALAAAAALLLGACGTRDAAGAPPSASARAPAPPPAAARAVPGEAAAWTAPEALPGGADAFLSPHGRVEDAAAGPGGAVHAVFSDTRAPARGWNRVLYAGSDGRAWAAPVAVDETPGRTHAPRVAVDGAGRVHVLWWKALDPRRPEACTHLLHRVRDGARWLPVDTLYRDPGGVGDAQLAVVADARGRLHVVHARAAGGHGHLVLDGGRRQAGTPPGFTGGYLAWDRAAARAGRLRLAFVAAQITEAVRRANNDLWLGSLDGEGGSGPVPVYAAPSRTHDPALVTDAAGVRHLVWTERNARGRSERLLHATSRDGVRWSPPADVTPPSAQADFYAPRLGLDRAGRPHLVFLRAGPRGVVPLHTRLEGGRWAPPRPLAPGAAAATLDLQLADDGRGTLHALWKGPDGRYLAARFPR